MGQITELDYKEHLLKLSLGNDKLHIFSNAFNKTFIEELTDTEIRLLEQVMDSDWVFRKLTWGYPSANYQQKELTVNSTAIDFLELVMDVLKRIDFTEEDFFHAHTPGLHVPELAEAITNAEYRLWRRFAVKLICYCEANSLGDGGYRKELQDFAYCGRWSYHECFDDKLINGKNGWFWLEEQERYKREIAEIFEPSETEAA